MGDVYNVHDDNSDMVDKKLRGTGQPLMRAMSLQAEMRGLQSRVQYLEQPDASWVH